MAEKAKKVSFTPDMPMMNMAKLAIGGQSGIKDPYSGKYYGELSYDKLLSLSNEAGSRINQQKTQAGNSIAGSNLNQLYEPFGVLSRLASGQPQQTLGQYLSSQLSNIFIPKREDYIQQAGINQSYQVYGDDWDKYFQGNYQNPRLAEEQANRQARGKQQFSQRANQAQAVQAVSEGTDMASSRKTMGTGVGTSTFNPFATLEAGLGL